MKSYVISEALIKELLKDKQIGFEEFIKSYNPVEMIAEKSKVKWDIEQNFCYFISRIDKKYHGKSISIYVEGKE